MGYLTFTGPVGQNLTTPNNGKRFGFGLATISNGSVLDQLSSVFPIIASVSVTPTHEILGLYDRWTGVENVSYRFIMMSKTGTTKITSGLSLCPDDLSFWTNNYQSGAAVKRDSSDLPLVHDLLSKVWGAGDYPLKSTYDNDIVGYSPSLDSHEYWRGVGDGSNGGIVSFQLGETETVTIQAGDADSYIVHNLLNEQFTLSASNPSETVDDFVVTYSDTAPDTGISSPTRNNILEDIITKLGG